MSYKSPLFRSGLELYAVAVELYATATKNPATRQRNCKVAILHLANAVELILKDTLLDLGQSIYKSPKETIGIWDAFRLHEQYGIDVPGKAHIELLIDDRNTIQHRFGFPDEQATFFYIDEVGKFLRHFLKDRYDLHFDDEIPNYLDSSYLPIIGVAATPKVRVTAMFKLSPSTAVVEAFKDLEEKLLCFYPGREGEIPLSLSRKLLPRILTALVEAKLLPAEALDKFEQLTRVRNAAVHGRGEEDWKPAIDLYLELLAKLEHATKNEFIYQSSPAEYSETASEIGASFALSWIQRAAPEGVRQLLLHAPSLPKELDAQLLQHAVQVLGLTTLDDSTRRALRTGFWKAVQASSLPPQQSP